MKHTHIPSPHGEGIYGILLERLVLSESLAGCIVISVGFVHGDASWEPLAEWQRCMSSTATEACVIYKSLPPTLPPQGFVLTACLWQRIAAGCIVISVGVVHGDAAWEPLAERAAL